MDYAEWAREWEQSIYVIDEILWRLKQQAKDPKLSTTEQKCLRAKIELWRQLRRKQMHTLKILKTKAIK